MQRWLIRSACFCPHFTGNYIVLLYFDDHTTLLKMDEEIDLKQFRGDLTSKWKYSAWFNPEYSITIIVKGGIVHEIILPDICRHKWDQGHPWHYWLTQWGREKKPPFRRLRFQMHFLNEQIWISLKISLTFVPNVPFDNIPVLVRKMAWRPSMMVSLLTHIYVTRPQWVNCLITENK